MKVFGYHHLGLTMDRSHWSQTELWKYTWERAGWEPVLLDSSASSLHPECESLRRTVLQYPTLNGPAYEVACYLRWLAYATALESYGLDEALVVDLDVVNRGFTPGDYDLCVRPALPGFAFLLLGVDKTPCCARVNRGTAPLLLSWFRGVVPERDCETHGIRPHLSDQVIIGRRWPGFVGNFESDRPKICGDPRNPNLLPLQHASTPATWAANRSKFELMMDLFTRN